MTFELHAMLDKIKFNNENEMDKEKSFKQIESELKEKVEKYGFFVSEKAKLNDTVVNSLHISKSYYDGFDSSYQYQGVKLIFQSVSFDENAIKAIYETFNYLSNLTDSKDFWDIEVEYCNFKDLQKSKYTTVITREIVAWAGKKDKEIDIIDFLKYISCERTLYKKEDEFDEIIMQVKELNK